MNRLEVRPEEIAQYCKTVFRNVSLDRVVVSVRAFYEGADNRPFEIKPVLMAGTGLQPAIDIAVQVAQRAADAPGATVFCLPPATFKDDASAKEDNVAEAPVLCVECDSHPRDAQQKLEAMLGPATFVIAPAANGPSLKQAWSRRKSICIGG